MKLNVRAVIVLPLLAVIIAAAVLAGCVTVSNPRPGRFVVTARSLADAQAKADQECGKQGLRAYMAGRNYLYEFVFDCVQ